MNVCSDNIAKTIQLFVTKLCMMLYCHELKCHTERNYFALFKMKVTASAYTIEI